MRFKKLEWEEGRDPSPPHRAYTAERTLDAHLTALCADYDRRARVLEEESATRRVLMTYKCINCRMLDAAISVAGSRDGPIFIKEIGNRTGYTSSEIMLSESVYKIRKLEVKLAILRKLGLLDAPY